MNNFLTELQYIIIGIIAGIVRLIRIRECNMLNLLRGSLISGFSAWMGKLFLAGLHETANTDLLIFTAGICGYLGPRALDLFAEIIERRILSLTSPPSDKSK